jgi:hypothetical protein
VARIYEAGVTKTTGAAAGPIVTIATGTRRCEVLELGIFATTAVAGEVGTGRPANTPAGALTGTLVQAGDGSDEAGTTTNTTSWATTQPTAPTNPMRRIQLPAVIGAGIVWTWGPGELMIPASAAASAIVVWQFSALAVTYDVYVKVRE